MRAAGFVPKLVLSGMLSLSGVGITLGTLFFAAALTPTLVPRSFSTQGVLAGACFAIGYGAGVLWRWLWRYLELPQPPERRLSRKAGIMRCCLKITQGANWYFSCKTPRFCASGAQRNHFLPR